MKLVPDLGQPRKLFYCMPFNFWVSIWWSTLKQACFSFVPLSSCYSNHVNSLWKSWNHCSTFDHYTCVRKTFCHSTCTCTGFPKSSQLLFEQWVKFLANDKYVNDLIFTHLLLSCTSTCKPYQRKKSKGTSNFYKTEYLIFLLPIKWKKNLWNLLWLSFWSDTHVIMTSYMFSRDYKVLLDSIWNSYGIE